VFPVRYGLSLYIVWRNRPIHIINLMSLIAMWLEWYDDSRIRRHFGHLPLNALPTVEGGMFRFSPNDLSGITDILLYCSV
jgi:hypothetical protein